MDKHIVALVLKVLWNIEGSTLSIIMSCLCFCSLVFLRSTLVVTSRNSCSTAHIATPKTLRFKSPQEILSGYLAKKAPMDDLSSFSPTLHELAS